MKKLVCTCACGAFSWNMTWDEQNPDFTLYEGQAGDCPKCNINDRPKDKPKLTVIDNSESFDQMMSQRKSANKKKNGGRR